MAKITQTKLKSTREALEIYLKIYEDYHPICRNSANTLFHRQLTEIHKDFDTACKVSRNAACRIRSAYDKLYPDTKPHDIVYKTGLISIGDYIDLIKTALQLPKELCNDHPV